MATFYFLGLQTARQSLQSMYTALAPAFPDDVRVLVEATGDIIESTTGDLVGTWVKDPLPVIIGGDTGAYAAPAGAMIRWNTAGIVAGRRVKGRTFLVPLGASNFNNFGALISATQSGLQTSTQAFVFEQSLDLVVWSRPFPGAPAVAGRPARPPRFGSHSLVVSSTVPAKVVVLRSRRD